MASIGTNGSWELVKRAGTAWDLFDDKRFNTMMTGTSYALIGHNRAATKGKVNNINAHPFEFQDVVGAHNGTLRGQYRLPNHTAFEVDSENIFYSIQQNGLDETLQILDGAYALTYWDKRSEELTLIRNDERTLFYCYSEDLKTVFWASEEWMLHVALSKHSIKYGEIMDVSPGHIYRFSFERKFNAGEITLNLEEYDEPNFPLPQANLYGNRGGYASGGGKGKPAPPAPKGGSDGTNGANNQGQHLRVNPHSLINHRADFVLIGEDTTQLGQPFLICELLCDTKIEARVFIASKLKDEIENMRASMYDTVFSAVWSSYRDGILTANPGTVIEVAEEEDDGDDLEEETKPGFEGTPLNFVQWREATKRDCSCCGDPVLWDQGDELVWLDKDTFVCPACQELDWVKEYITYTA